MRAFFLRVGSPFLAAPVEAFLRYLAVLALPPHVAIGGQTDVGEDGVALDHLHRIRIRLPVRARHYAEVTGLGVDGVKPSVRAGSHPGDVVADSPDFPAGKMFWWNHHREVRLAAGTWECRCHERFL